VVTTTKNAGFASKNMALLGSLIFVFLVIHMGDFWYSMKFTEQLPYITYEGQDVGVKDLYSKVMVTFKQPGFVIGYVFAMIVLALHLLHGFQSAFQSLGLNHKKYTPLIKVLGVIYSILVPAAFAAIPLVMYFYR
jgi:succinate dehydrogenase / fumarate reductase cytochrome b subunit